MPAALQFAVDDILHAVLIARFERGPRRCHFAELGCGRVASVCGRYYAMDRDNRWDRMEGAYRLLTQGEADYTAASSTDWTSSAVKGL